MNFRTMLLAGAMALPAANEAMAQSARDTFTLGEVLVTARASDGTMIGGAVISADEARQQNRTSVDSALDLVPGANSSNTGGSRNERLIFVRGFDRFQTTLSIDGVRVFLPADNRIDFGRFLTADLAQIQVSKGYVSVLDGPGGLGGAVNLVTRKPTQAFEAEATAGAAFDRGASYNGYTVSGRVGTRQDRFYLQASGAKSDRDSWSLSKNYTPTALENGGARDHSESEDWRINLKAGFTPNETDEYALSFLRQSGSKNAPYHTTDTASTRFWSWPYWDIDSIYFLSNTQLGSRASLKTRVYYNTFDNLLSSYDSAAQNIQSLPRAFNSYYDDTASGAMAQLNFNLTDANTLRAAFHYRNDEHKERQDGFIRVPATGSPSTNRPYAEPWQTTQERTYSAALEDTAALSPNLDAVLGVSYDWTDLREAQDISVFASGANITQAPVTYPLRDMYALNGQGALTYRFSDATRVYASVSSRARFPTLFERFSSRMGTAIPNPNIKAERAVNYEIGGATPINPAVTLEGAVFYSELDNALIQIPVNLGGTIGTVNQTRNVAKGEYRGAEFTVTARAADNLIFGANYTYIDRDLKDPTNPNFRPQGVPKDKAFLYAAWRPVDVLTITPSVDIASERWTVTSSSLISPPRFYETGEYALLNLAVEWAVTPRADFVFGAPNLGDKDYMLADGFPEEGRNFYLSLRLKN